MDSRTKDILRASIKDFIETGRPITSESLFERYDFGIKPAMIRSELNDLGEKGYFYQYHPSGGRFPTDKTYRFFVDELIDSNEDKFEFSSKKISDFVRDFLTGEHDRFIEEMAGYLGTLSVGYDPENEWVGRCGFKNLFERLALNNQEEMLEVVNDFEALPSRLSKITASLNKEKEWPQVFIGRSPVTNSKNLSVMIEKLSPQGESFFFISIGPKRMDYEKSLRLMRGLAQSF